MSNIASSALAPLTTRLSFGANVAGALLLGIVLVVVGFVIIARRPALAVISPMGKVGAALNVAKSVGA